MTWSTSRLTNSPAALDESVAGDQIDLAADLNAQDYDGNGWSPLRDAREPARVGGGRMLLAANSQATAVVRVTGVDDNGQVHFAILAGSVSKNRHLLDRGSA